MENPIHIDTGTPVGVPPLATGSASALWKHMAETHKLHLLSSEENDIRHAANAGAEEMIRKLANEASALRVALGNLVDAVNIEFPGGMSIGGRTGPALIHACDVLAPSLPNDRTGHAIALAVESWLAPHGLRVCDYSTMAKGSWRIERDMPNARGYVEFWNDAANGWCSASTVYRSELEAFGRAVLLVANIEVRHARANNPAAPSVEASPE